MTEPNLSTTVNQHYLDKVMGLADVMTVAATEDIVDARGMKLLARGSTLSAAVREKLVAHKLKYPLESSILVDGAVDTKLIVDTATRLIDTSPPLARILAASGIRGGSPLQLLSHMKLGNAMSLMLTIAQRDGAQGLEHAVMVSLLSVCMARKQGLSDQDQMVAALAGLLHDVGELYIDPAYLVRGKRLLPHEWAHIVLHPRIGQLLIDDLESWTRAVGRAVAEHHERLDGTGYPRQLKGRAISGPGQAVSVAEMIAGLLHAEHPLERAELALKIIPGEHAHELLSAVSGALRLQQADGAAGGQPAGMALESVERLFWRITTTLAKGRALLAGAAASPSARELLEKTLDRTRSIQRAFVSTGLDVYLNQNHGFNEHADATIGFEKEVATREIQWRLRDIARDLALHSASPDEQVLFAPLIALLDDDRAPETAKPELEAEATPASAIPGPASVADSLPCAA